MNRRDFTKVAGLGLMAMQSFPTFATAEILKNETFKISKVPLGLCNHSLRGLRLNARQLIEYAIEQKLDSVLLNTFKPFESLDAAHLSLLNKMTKSNCVSIYIGVGSISEKSTKFSDRNGNAKELLLEGIRVASLVGSPIVGCRIGSIEDRYLDGGIEAHIDAVVKLMKSLRSWALDAEIKFAFENHAGDLRTEELLALINETGKDICGALFDPANAVWAMEDPMVALKKLGSTIICTSIRDVHVWETEEGATFQGVVIGKGIMNYPLYSKTIAKFCPRVPLHVETISNSARPTPFLKPEFWDGFPDLQASEIIDFLRLARKGIPLEIVHPSAGTNQRDFDIELQQSELLNSLDYLRNYCNAGMKY